MRKFIVFMLILLLGGSIASGCGKLFQAKESPKTSMEVVEGVSLNEDQMVNVKAFDEKLAAMETKEEAKELLSGFIDSVSGTFKDSGSLRMMSEDEKNKLDSALDRLADKEISSRGKGIRMLSMEDSLISPEKIADSIEDLSSKPVDTKQVADNIKGAQKELRGMVPHISPNGDENMTPIEAMMITYSMYAAASQASTGEAVKLDIPKDKAVQFVEKISE